MDMYEHHKARSYRCQAAAHKCEAEAAKHDTYHPERRADRIAHHEAMAAAFLDMADQADTASLRSDALEAA